MNERTGRLVLALILMLGCGGEDMAGGPCVAPDDCDAGRECIDGACSAECDDTLCQARLGSRAECRGGPKGRCDEVDCGRIVSCEAGICDATSHTCFPESGSCAEVEDCPLMFPGALEAGLSCAGGFCSFADQGDAVIQDAPNSSAIEITVSPDFESLEDFEVTLSAPPGVYLVVVTPSPPATLGALRETVIWVATVNESSVVRWGDGQVTATPGTLTGGFEDPLYTVVLQYGQGRLLGTSGVEAFLVGGSWKEPGAECADQHQIPSSCSNPARLQVCSFASVCEILCGSDRDCLTPDTTGFCDLPDAGGRRYCLR